MDKNSSIILDYLTDRGKPISAEGIANYLKLDNFLVEKILSELKLENKVEKKGNKYRATNYVTGFVKISNNGKMYINHDNKKILCNNISGSEITEGDSVLFKITKKEKNFWYGEIVGIVDKRIRNNVGTVISREGELVIKGKDKKSNIYIYPNSKVVSGDIVKYKLGDRIRDSFYEGEVLDVVGRVDEPKSDMTSILVTNNFHVKFPEEVMEEVKKIDETISLENRRDLRNNLIFTIDGDDTKDIDDAIELDKRDDGTYKLGVHIADVSNYVKIGSALDNEAFFRGTSVYPPSSVIPMLPHELSSGVCSLFENTDRYALSCVMEFSSSGDFMDCEFFPSVINSKKKMAYSKVNRLLDTDTPFGYEKFASELKLMNEFKSVLRKKRFENQSINFDIPKLGVKLNDLGTPISIYQEIRGEAEKLIEEFMLITNICTGMVEDRYGYGAFRTHDVPDIDKLYKATSILEKLGIKIPKYNDITKHKFIIELSNNIKNGSYKDLGEELLLKCMSRAQYSRVNTGHYGLNFKRYAQFTSPIRRYPDLTNHRVIKDIYGIANPNFPTDRKAYLNNVCSHASMQERNADAAEAIIKKMKMAEFIQDEVGKDYEGQVVDVYANSIEVKLSNGITGTIDLGEGKDFNNFSVRANGKTYRYGQMLNVAIEDVSINPAVISLVDTDVKRLSKKYKH
nr:VacB/RNase II family 3'-5' exoribonuclease [Bacilli bacterium]